LGSALGGEFDGLWRWRIGDYRVVAKIEDERITILVVRVAHPPEVYR
jgi:mRNA interferase RelE/StbE